MLDTISSYVEWVISLCRYIVLVTNSIDTKFIFLHGAPFSFNASILPSSSHAIPTLTRDKYSVKTSEVFVE